MNIRAVFAVLRLEGLDHSAKCALIVMACRAHQHTAIAEVSVSRVAADIGVSYKTAWAALNRLVEAGYVTVDKLPGRTPMWMLTPVVVTGVPMQSTPSTPVAITEDPCNGYRTKESLEKTKDRVPHFSPGSGLIVDFTSRRKTNGDR